MAGTRQFDPTETQLSMLLGTISDRLERIEAGMIRLIQLEVHQQEGRAALERAFAKIEKMELAVADESKKRQELEKIVNGFETGRKLFVWFVASAGGLSLIVGGGVLWVMQRAA